MAKKNKFTINQDYARQLQELNSENYSEITNEDVVADVVEENKEVLSEVVNKENEEITSEVASTDKISEKSVEIDGKTQEISEKSLENKSDETQEIVLENLGDLLAKIENCVNSKNVINLTLDEYLKLKTLTPNSGLYNQRYTIAIMKLERTYAELRAKEEGVKLPQYFRDLISEDVKKHPELFEKAVKIEAAMYTVNDL